MSSFDAQYGKGALEELRRSLTFEGVEAQIQETTELVIGGGILISFIWPEVGHCDIRIVDQRWVFQHLESSSSGMFKFLCSILPAWARDHGVERFDAFPGDQTARAIFTGGGFEPAGGGRLEDHLADSKLEEYGATRYSEDQ